MATSIFDLLEKSRMSQLKSQLFFKNGEDVSRQRSLARLPPAPPCRFAQIPAAHNPCMLTRDYERRVSIHCTYAWVGVFASYVTSNRRVVDVHRGFVWPYLCLLLASVCFYSLGVVVYLIFERLGVDLELRSCPSDLQKQWFQPRHSMFFEKAAFYIR